MYEKTVGGERKELEDYTSNISYVHVLIKMMFPSYLCLSHTDMSKQPSVPPLTPSGAVQKYLTIVNRTKPNCCVWLPAHAISLLKEQRAVFLTKEISKILGP